MKYIFLTACFLQAVLLFGQQVPALHHRAVVADLHNDVITESIMRGKDISKRLASGHTDIPRLKEGGVDLQFFSVWCDGKQKHPFVYANKQISALQKLVREHPEELVLAANGREVEQGIKEGKIVAMIGVEGGHMIEDHVEYMDSLYKRGARYLTLTWNNSTDWASSAADESGNKVKHKGLSEFGKQIVKHMNDIGMMIDLSHVGEQTFYDVLDMTTKPVLVSHSDVFAISPHYRNLKDDQIRAIAKNGGVIGVNFYNDFLDPDYRKKVSACYARYVDPRDSLKLSIDKKFNALPAKAKEELRPPLSLLVDHIDYIVRVGGIDHVGIGADFDGMESTPVGLNGVQDYPKLTAALLERGYSETDIRKLLGENVLRVIKAQEN